MKFLFDDESFSCETLRAAGFALYGGADLGQVLVTAGAITGGDEASWHRASKATAERPQDTGERAIVATEADVRDFLPVSAGAVVK
jgi:hypothetical protein